MKTSIIYQGPSLLDHNPIMVLAQSGSRNTKTGDMVQTFIMRSDMDPITASRTGADASMCGDCLHKGTPHDGDRGWAKDRTCYVTLIHAPLGKYKAYRKGRYPFSDDLPSIGRDRMVRIGTYGDGAAVPQPIWEQLCQEATGWTAYSHQKNPDPTRFMTSVETLSETYQAWGRGERTFRVLSDVSEKLDQEVLCPASAEAGKRTTCASCLLCAGTSIQAKSIAIVAHGSPSKTLKDRLRILEKPHETEAA